MVGPTKDARWLSLALAIQCTGVAASSGPEHPVDTTGIAVVQDYGQGGALSGGNARCGWSARLADTCDAPHAAIQAASEVGCPPTPTGDMP